MKITKNIVNPIHVGSLLIDRDVTVIDGPIEPSVEKALKAYEANGDVTVEWGPKPKPMARLKIQEAEDVVVEEEPAPKPKPYKRKSFKKPSPKTDG